MERGNVGRRFLNRERLIGYKGGSCQWVKRGFLGKKGVLGEEECSWVGRGFLGRGGGGVLGSKVVNRKGGGSWILPLIFHKHL